MKVAIVEADKLGGTCLHRGCIPTKTLLRTAELHRQATLSLAYGIDVTVNHIDFAKVQSRKNAVIEQLHQGINALMKKNHIDVYHGYGRILGPSIFSPLPGTISVEYTSGEENTLIVPKYVLIATGSKPRTLPNLDVDGKKVMTSDEALEMDTLPESIIIIGGGVIGIEWASLLCDLGVNVTIVENAPDILMSEDDDVRREVKKQLKKRGIAIFTKANVLTETLVKDETGVSLTIEVDEKSET